MTNTGILSYSEEIPNVIYYGSPGTGKTYSVNIGIDLLLFLHQRGVPNDETIENVRKKCVVNIQCHPGFGYEEFIEGLKPMGYTENGMIKLEVLNGEFKNLCIAARDNPNEKFYFVADEINRANLSAMFGETLSLLEADYRDFRKGEGNSEERKPISTPMSQMIAAFYNNKLSENGADKAKIFEEIKSNVYECDLVCADKNIKKLSDVTREKAEVDVAKIDSIKNVRFGIPKNIIFIGMMNDVDKSIDAFDLALRRRFRWIKKSCDYDVLEGLLSKKVKNGLAEYIQACNALNEYISSSASNGLGFGESYQFGHAYFMKIQSYVKQNKITEGHVTRLFDEHLKPVLTEYIRTFMDESEIDRKIDEAGDKFRLPFKNKKTKSN